MNDPYQEAVEAAKDVTNTAKDAAQSGVQRLREADVPGRTRDFMQKAVGSAQERTAQFQAGASKGLQAVQHVMVNSIGEFAKVGREIQEATLKDAEAFWAHAGKLASVKDFGQAVQLQNDFLRERGEVIAARARSASEYFTRMFSEGVKTVQNNISEATSAGRKAA